MKIFEKSELKYIIFSYIFIGLIVLSMNIPSVLVALSSLNPIIQFLLFNLGVYFVFFFFLKGVALKEKFSTLFRGALGGTLGFIGMDILIPEYHVTAKSLIVGGVYGASSSDYFFGYLYNQYLGISGILLPIMVYFVTFTILFAIASYLVKDFVRKL